MQHCLRCSCPSRHSLKTSLKMFRTSNAWMSLFFSIGIETNSGITCVKHSAIQTKETQSYLLWQPDTKITFLNCIEMAPISEALFVYASSSVMTIIPTVFFSVYLVYKKEFWISIAITEQKTFKMLVLCCLKTYMFMCL